MLEEYFDDLDFEEEDYEEPFDYEYEDYDDEFIDDDEEMDLFDELDELAEEAVYDPEAEDEFIGGLIKAATSIIPGVARKFAPKVFSFAKGLLSKATSRRGRRRILKSLPRIVRTATKIIKRNPRAAARNPRIMSSALRRAYRLYAPKVYMTPVSRRRRR